MELFLIRHGRTEWNVAGRVMGDQPIPLTPEGEAQIDACARFLEGVAFDAVYASPTRRTRESADILVRERGLTYTTDPALVEIHYGQWVGCLYSELCQRPEFLAYAENPLEAGPPGGETIAQTCERIVGLVTTLYRQHAGQRVMLVSHADVIKCLLCHYLGMPLARYQQLRIDNGSISIVRVGEKSRVMGINVVPDGARYASMS